MSRYVPLNSGITACPEIEEYKSQWISVFNFQARKEVTSTWRAGYGYNGHGIAPEHPELMLGLGGFGRNGERERWLNESAVRSPSQVIAFGDIGETFGHRIAPLSSPVTSLPKGRHGGRANMVFCDGHVDHATQSRWTEPSEPARRLWNNDNLPHSELW